MTDQYSKETGRGLYLASKSPRRREILTQIGVRFTTIDVDIEESRTTNEAPVEYVRRLALEKARAGWRILQHERRPEYPLLSADTIGLFDGQVLEKPRDLKHFTRVMQMLSGQTHSILTAVAMTDGVDEMVKHVETRVTFRHLNETEILRYWNTGEPQDKACGYAIQGFGAVFIASISGSYTGVVGLPIEVTTQLLAHFNICWWYDTSVLV